MNTQTPPSKRVSISRTDGEWQAIQKKLMAKGGQNFHTYLHMQASRLRNIYLKCRECITPASGSRIKKRHNIPPEIYAELHEIAVIMKKDVGTILDEFFIAPLLTPDTNVAL